MSHENQAHLTYTQIIQGECLPALPAAVLNTVSTRLLPQRADVLQFLLIPYRISEQNTLYKSICICEAFP